MNNRAYIRSTGMYVPDKVVTNDDLSKLMDTSDEWIQKRSGIICRQQVLHDRVFFLRELNPEQK